MVLSDAAWRKAKKSGENGGACVELASLPGIVAIRDSKNPMGPKLLVSRDDFRRFTEAVNKL